MKYIIFKYCVFAFFILIYQYMAMFLIECSSGLVRLLIYFLLFFKCNKSEKPFHVCLQKVKYI